jgi:hypothetical protein
MYFARKEISFPRLTAQDCPQILEPATVARKIPGFMPLQGSVSLWRPSLQQSKSAAEFAALSVFQFSI